MDDIKGLKNTMWLPEEKKEDEETEDESKYILGDDHERSDDIAEIHCPPDFDVLSKMVEAFVKSSYAVTVWPVYRSDGIEIGGINTRCRILDRFDVIYEAVDLEN